MPDDTTERFSQAWWEQRLPQRLNGTSWQTIGEAEGIPEPTMRRNRRKAEQSGWIPVNENLPAPMKSDGRRASSRKKRPQETPISEDVTEVLPNQIDRDANTVADDPMSVSALADIVPMREPLSPTEVQTLQHYEEIIAQGFKTFVQVGQALLAIRDQHLYRQDHGTFEDYLRQRWDLSRPYAYQLMDASVVVQNLSAGADIVTVHGHTTSGAIVPANEAQARPLASLPPEQQREVWGEAVKTAPAGKMTAKHVQETVKRAKPTGTTPPKTTTPKPPKLLLFDVQDMKTKIKELYMDWLKHCDTDDALETAQFFLNTLSDLAQGRAMLLHQGR